MADIKDLKNTKDYLEQLKNALAELNSKNDFNITISVNGTPIEEFFQKLEGLDTGEIINSLKDGLSNIDFKTTGVSESAESNDPTTESINGIEKFNESVNNLIAALQNRASVATYSQGQNSELTMDSSSLNDLDIDFSSDFVDDLNDDLGDIDDLDDISESAEELTDAANSLAKTADVKAKQQVTQPTEVSKQDAMLSDDSDDLGLDLGDFEGKAEDVLDVIADTTGKLSDAAGEIANNADDQHSKVYELDEALDSDDTAIDLGDLSSYDIKGLDLPDSDIKGLDLPDYDIEGSNEAVDSLQVVNKSLKSAGIELADSTNSLADGSNDLANTVSDEAGDLKDAYDEAVSVIKDTPSEVDSETYEQQDKERFEEIIKKEHTQDSQRL